MALVHKPVGVGVGVGVVSVAVSVSVPVPLSVPVSASASEPAVGLGVVPGGALERAPVRVGSSLRGVQGHGDVGSIHQVRQSIAVDVPETQISAP